MRGTPPGAPASGLTGPEFTPPFPAHASGHAGFGSALFQPLRRCYGTDRIALTFVSDEFNGVTQDRDFPAAALTARRAAAPGRVPARTAPGHACCLHCGRADGATVE